MKVTAKKCHYLFPVPVAAIQFGEFEETNKKIIEEIDKVDWDEHHKKQGIGYDPDHTLAEDTFITDKLVPSIRPVLLAFLKNCNALAERLTWAVDPAKTRLTGYWAHMTEPNEVTIPHHHIGPTRRNHLSGAYYVYAPRDCGNIVFSDDRLIRVYEPEIKDPNAANMSLEAVFRAKEGLMLIFPSWLRHRVGKNQSSERRVSLSFNASFELV